MPDPEAQAVLDKLREAAEIVVPSDAGDTFARMTGQMGTRERRVLHLTAHLLQALHDWKPPR